MNRSSRKRHRPEEVVAKLGQADEALAKGAPIAEVARSLGVSEVTRHRWRAEYGAMDRNVGAFRFTDLQWLTWARAEPIAVPAQSLLRPIEARGAIGSPW